MKTLSVLACIVCLPAVAVAGEGRPANRGGLVLGFSVGGGSTIDCDACTNAAGALYAGVMARRDLAIVTDFSVVRGEDGTPGSLGVAAVALQYWPAGDRFWLKGGVGGSRTFDWQDWGEAGPASRRRFAGIVGAGVEVARGDTFGLDLHTRGAFSSSAKSVAAGIGFSWYTHRPPAAAGLRGDRE